MDFRVGLYTAQDRIREIDTTCDTRDFHKRMLFIKFREKFSISVILAQQTQ